MADKKIKISQNPVKAFYQGKAEGEKIAHARYIWQGIKVAYAYILLSMYNANDRSDEDKNDFMTKPQLKEFYLRFAAEIEQQITEAVENNENLDEDDLAGLHVSHDDFIRKKLGLPRKKYDGTDGGIL